MSDQVLVYFHISLSGIACEQEELVTAYCFESGASGVSEELEFTQTRDDYQPEIVEAEFKTLNVFFEQRPSDGFSLSIKEKFPEIKISMNEEKNKDWLAEWKKGYKAFALAGEYWVVPTWLEKPQEAEKAIWIDPGMAFGTGTHETTQMAAEILLDNVDGKTVLDVGTGTGILSFLCRMNGATKAVATEIDAEARRVARENVEINKLDQIEVLEEQVDSITEKFDVVIANIIDGILRKLKPDLLRCLKKDGCLVLSGILVENEKEFLEEFLTDTSLQMVERLQKGEWLGFRLVNR